VNRLGVDDSAAGHPAPVYWIREPQSSPFLAAAAPRDSAHSRQNFAWGVFSCWHRGHFMRTPHALGAAQVRRR
jgi:hypothetical protein